MTSCSVKWFTYSKKYKYNYTRVKMQLQIKCIPTKCDRNFVKLKLSFLCYVTGWRVIRPSCSSKTFKHTFNLNIFLLCVCTCVRACVCVINHIGKLIDITYIRCVAIYSLISVLLQGHESYISLSGNTPIILQKFENMKIWQCYIDYEYFISRRKHNLFVCHFIAP
jgi:hypothetical protein